MSEFMERQEKHKGRIKRARAEARKAEERTRHQVWFIQRHGDAPYILECCQAITTQPWSTKDAD